MKRTKAASNPLPSLAASRLKSRAHAIIVAIPMPAPIPVFDIGNVLVRWDPRHLYRKLIAEEAAREDFLARICSPAWNLEMDRGRPFAEGVAELVARHPEHEALIRAFDERWLETLDGTVEEAVAILEELRAAGVKTYAITNFSREKFALDARALSLPRRLRRHRRLGP